MSGGRLVVKIDGKALPEEEARALWVEFSRYMDEHEGDFDGFAKSKGYASVAPEHQKGKAVLLVKTAKKA